MSTGELTPADVAHVARLARLELSPEEVEHYRRELGVILAYVRRLEELDLEEVAPMVAVQPRNNVLRDDLPSPVLPRDAALANAPDTREGFIRVPRVLP